jgi:hypothetical protein
MSFIFLDESGDLGFNFRKKKTSRYFIITCLFTNDKGPVEKIVKKIFKGFKKIEIKNHHGTLHCYKEKAITKQRVLQYLNDKNVSIIAIYLNKATVYTRLQDEKHVLYNYVANIVLDRMYTKKLVPIREKVQLIASRRETNKFLNQNFCVYIQKQISYKHKFKIEVLIRSPQQEKALQIVDFASWAIFRKHEYNDESFSIIIKSRIKEEVPLFP